MAGADLDHRFDVLRVALPGILLEFPVFPAVFERIGARSSVDRSAALLRRLGAVAPARSPQSRAAALASLSVRESEVVRLVRDGCGNADIAARLYISPKTAEHHVSRVLAKLGVRTRAEAAALAATLDPRP